MLRIAWITGALLVTMALMPVVGFAQQKEHGGTAEHGGATTATPAAPEPAPTPAPATTPTAPPALKPIVITFTGELAELKTDVTPARITVKDRYGVSKEIACPADCTITQGTQAKTVADLTQGARLTVEYIYDVASGERTAQSITIGEASPATTP